MHNDRFDAITAELERLAMEIAAINRQPFDTRIDLRSITEKTESDEELPLISVNDWRLHR